MTLKNLNELGVAAKTRYDNSYHNREVKLHEGFKEKYKNYLQNKGNTIKYFDYSAEITINASRNKIFLPNQWFCIATYLAEFTSELMEYKSVLEYVFQNGNHELNSRQFWDMVKNAKGVQIENINETLKSELISYFEDDQNEYEKMITFLINYNWWFGSKTIDRPDFYVSPVLHLLGVVNVAQSYIADIVLSYTADPLLMEEAMLLLSEIERVTVPNEMVKGGKNVIVYGAPGTGKSRYVEDTYTNITRVVFHSEYTYFDFVGSYKPVPVYKVSTDEIRYSNGEAFEYGIPLIDYAYVIGPFLKVLISSVVNPTVLHTLLIEEVNRANAPSVFGDIFQLLDRDANGMSEYRIQPNNDLDKYIKSRQDISQYFVDGLYIPSNMNIIATMNSADQGVLVLDSAFKRRWEFKYMPIIESGFVHENTEVNYGGRRHKWSSLLLALNSKLKEYRVEEDRLVGPYFINKDEINDPSFIYSKLFLYLWDDVLRHKRDSFFEGNNRTYYELICNYLDGIDVLGISERLDAANINQEDNSLEQTDNSDDE